MTYLRLLITVLLALLLMLPSVTQALNIELNFTGSTFFDSGFIPPDTMGAAGPHHFVELINGRYSVYHKTDGVRVQTTTLNDFWRNAGVTPVGNFAFDPRVNYDPASQRWFAASVDNAFGPNNFLVAVSKSSNPTQGWKGFAIPSDSNKSHWADFPTLGVNRNGVYVAANMFSVTGLGGITTAVLVLPKADLIAGTVAHRTLLENALVTTGLSPQPVTDPKSTGVPVGTLLSGFNTGSGGGQFKRSDVMGSVTSPALDNTMLIAVPPFGTSPNAVQPGPKARLEVGDGRLSSSAVMRNGELWGVQTVNSGGRSALRWFDIDAATNTLQQSGLIASPTLAFYYGSIAVNDFGQIVIGFSGSGPSQFVSAYAVEGRTIDGVTTFDDPVLLKAGVSDYEVTSGTGRNRWGDYSATTLDPHDPFTFWTIQEWVSGTDIWATQITELQLNAVPEPTTLLLVGTTMAGLGLARWRQRRRKQQTAPAD